jgi:hypothetical protein
MDSFVKAEKNPKPVPRVIQPRRQEYNIAVGRYIRQIEHPLYRCIQRIFKSDTPIVMKGLNAEQVGRAFERKWAKFTRPVAIGLDASRFDQHVSKPVLQWEHSVYNGIFNSNELRRLLSWQVRNKGFGNTKDGRIMYEVEGCRMSGDMNTAMGNCLIMCALVHAYMGDVKYEFANNGDDCVVFIEREDVGALDDLPQWFNRRGFIMKVENPVYTLEHVEFCQCKPVYLHHSYTMVRNYPTSLLKDAIIIKPMINKRLYQRYLYTIGMGGLALTSGCPINQEFYSRMIECGYPSMVDDPSLDNGFKYFSKGMEARYYEVSPKSRYSFWLAFGILPDEQVVIEAKFKELSYLFDKHPLGTFTNSILHYG